jgi:2,5-dichloro-2,5-cyclohexadiene-1,4-diol dehydrogenase 1
LHEQQKGKKVVDVQGKVIICTGAASGIGRAAAIVAAVGGASVIVADIHEDGGEQTVSLIRQQGGVAAFICTDIGDEENVRRMVQFALDRHGRLDGAFNNAALPQSSKLLHEMPSSTWRRCLDVNLTGTFYCMKYEIQAMLQAGGGAICNTSSGAGLTGLRLGSEYSATKFGVVGLTRSAALDYAAKNIRINALAPGGTLTPMLEGAMQQDSQLETYLKETHPIGRLGKPSELGEAAIWLLSDAASFVVGTCFAVDGGYTA